MMLFFRELGALSETAKVPSTASTSRSRDRASPSRLRSRQPTATISSWAAFPMESGRRHSKSDRLLSHASGNSRIDGSPIFEIAPRLNSRSEMAVTWPLIDTMMATINSLSVSRQPFPRERKYQGIFTRDFRSRSIVSKASSGATSRRHEPEPCHFRLDVRSPRMARPALDAKQVDHGQILDGQGGHARPFGKITRATGLDEGGRHVAPGAKPAKAAPVLAMPSIRRSAPAGAIRTSRDGRSPRACRRAG